MFGIKKPPFPPLMAVHHVVALPDSARLGFVHAVVAASATSHAWRQNSRSRAPRPAIRHLAGGVRGLFVTGLATTILTACSQASPVDPAPTPTGLSITGAPTFTEVNQTAQLTATIRLSNGQTQDQTSTAAWSSANPSVAAVTSAGVVLSLSHGTTTITASTQGMTATIPASVTIACIARNSYTIVFGNRSRETVHEIVFDGVVLFLVAAGQNSPPHQAAADVAHVVHFRDPAGRGGCAVSNTPIVPRCAQVTATCDF